MPIARFLLLRQRRHGSHRDKEGSQGSPLTPGSPDNKGKGQRFFGSNMTKTKHQNGSTNDHKIRAGKRKSSNTDNGPFFVFFNVSKVAIIIVTCTIAVLSFVLVKFDFWFFLTTGLFVSDDLSGGWQFADDHTNRKYDTNICDIDRKWSYELTVGEFESTYRYKKPVIVRFPDGAKNWTDPEKWTTSSLRKLYGEWSVMSGNSREIVRRGGTGDTETTFNDFLDAIMNKTESFAEPQYIFDRHFYSDTELPSTLNLPAYFKVRDELDDSIFFLGGSSSGVSFHKHADAWNGVVYGRKRWFLYPIEKTPPGGVYPGFTTIEWFDHILPHLPQVDQPIQCIQEPGEILYLPEGIYHATINLGDTIAVGLQKKMAVTSAEKLFYEENEISKLLGRDWDSEKKMALSKRKQQIFELLLDLLPDNAEVHMRAGQMYKNEGDMKKALEHTEIALLLDKYFIVAMLNLADTQSKLGHADKADQLYKQALTLNPRLWDVYAFYGDFLLNQNRPEEAAQMYKKGIELQTDSLVFHKRLKLSLERAGDIKGAAQVQKDIDKLEGRS